jgi:superfamily I DNA/RNA helicase
MGRGEDYITIINALKEIPFSPGRKLLCAYLNGDKEHQSLKAHRLDRNESFGLFSYSSHEIGQLLNEMAAKGLIREASLQKNKYWKIIEVTDKGNHELQFPSHLTQGYSEEKENEMIVSSDHKAAFEEVGSFLKDLTDEQKLAVIANENDIVCIAGAGSGKTRVLTHRIMFLTKYKSVSPSKILAITFTRKARDEMLSRLHESGYDYDYDVETFNSFCEKILRKHNDKAYTNGRVAMISFSDRIRIMRKALDAVGKTMEEAVRLYFTEYQIRNKTTEQLSFSLMNDCYFVRDYYKSIGSEIDESILNMAGSDNRAALEMIISIARYIEAYMRKNGLRDFNDQIVDAIRLFESHPETIPLYEHLLVDEYQDVNDMQVKLMGIIKPKSTFIVGDPRQSIFGWRGSDIRFIMEKSRNASTVYLKENFRSSSKIVEFANESIKAMGLSGLISRSDNEGTITIDSFASEKEEITNAISRIRASGSNLQDIFVLARTNRILDDFSNELSSIGIPHIMRNEESQESLKEGFLTLSTVHGIKGLEADTVIVLGCTPLNFPIKGSDHPVVEIMRSDDYDKEAEERRLFYVAITRAKKNLHISYAGKRHTSYITPAMLRIAGKNANTTSTIESYVNDSSSLERLKKWRRDLSSEMGLPAYMILTDQSLIAIASMNPMELEDLMEVPGIGPFKAKKYGKEVLRVLHGL